MCHRLNTVLCDGWKEANLKSPELKEYSTSAFELVAYCRTSVGLQEQLPITIKSGCATRGWTATEQRATSIEKSKDEPAIVLAGRNRLYLLSAINLDLNRSVSILYKTFRLVFKKLVASNSPTINLVIPCYYNLHSLLKRIPGDEQPILVLKQCIMDGLNNKFYGSIKAIHWLGTFLDPSFRSFSFMPKISTSDLEFKERTINDVDKWVLEQICQLKPNADEEPSVTRRRAEPTIPTQQQDFFSDMRENFAENQSIPVGEIAYDERALRFCGSEEIEVYKSLSIAVADCGVLQFWRKNSDKLPLLSRVARKVLGTQANSGQSERLYSDCGLTISERRAKLSPTTMAFKKGLYK